MKVADGDTITILDANNNLHKIRLHGIDTPERGQAYGQAAKDMMSGLVAGRDVGIEVKDTDRYGRTVGVVYLDGNNINLELVRRGYAWWYQRYARTEADLEEGEINAKTNRLGLWADPNPIAPWDWRRGSRYSVTADAN